jgi:uncharacterized protein
MSGSNEDKPGISNRLFNVKRLFFPVINSFVMLLFFGLTGYYLSDFLHWALIGLAVGLGIGIIAEFGLGSIGGWIYRRRVVMIVMLEIVLNLAVFAPFIYMYGYTTPVKHPVCCMETSGLGSKVEPVLIPVADGETLSGWYAPPAETPGPVVLVLHGSGGDRTGSLAHARVLHDAGYGVLVYDQRACGESTGDRRSMGLYDARDIPLIINWLSSRPEVDVSRIGGVGLSLGAHILLRAAPEETRLRAIWSDGLGSNTVEDVPAYEGVTELFTNFIDGQAYLMGELYLGDKWIGCKKLIPQVAPRHLMLVAAGQDFYEKDFNRGYEPYLGENGKLWIIEDAGHVGGLFTNPPLYKERLINFFDQAL